MHWYKVAPDSGVHCCAGVVPTNHVENAGTAVSDLKVIKGTVGKVVSNFFFPSYMYLFSEIEI